MVLLAPHPPCASLAFSDRAEEPSASGSRGETSRAPADPEARFAEKVPTRRETMSSRAVQALTLRDQPGGAPGTPRGGVASSAAEGGGAAVVATPPVTEGVTVAETPSKTEEKDRPKQVRSGRRRFHKPGCVS